MPETLAQSIKTEARRLGFALAGITTPDPPPHASAYENWLAMGRHAQMAYLADERARTLRLDPRRILPECRSILVLGIRYPAPHPHPLPHPLSFRTIGMGEGRGEGESPRGRVAAYAWGMDYHLVLPERLRALAAFIEAQVGHPIPNRAYTDSGPILERDLAQRAGLGWIGKNTCLIDPRLGSYFLLAEILLGIQLEPDSPFESDRCGTCTRCIDACPTACILPDRSLDARRCISYLTIELKGEIPLDLRSRMGKWVFGCDVCQMVCPWNRFAEAAGERTFAPRPGVPRPDLIAELALSPQEFNRKFKDSPVQRARRRGYLRNVAIALGNARDPAALPALREALRDSEPLVRASVAWAIEQIRTRIRDNR
ncbi:MAG: tRNA epoxyqueuosine(34) reductase QueG [Chloroflexi bacterium]|nr:tRNA epoxyqueuosine(34) reductase QueG [Chloroflexota bacterium]